MADFDSTNQKTMRDHDLAMGAYMYIGLPFTANIDGAPTPAAVAHRRWDEGKGHFPEHGDDLSVQHLKHMLDGHNIREKNDRPTGRSQPSSLGGAKCGEDSHPWLEQANGPGRSKKQDCTRSSVVQTRNCAYRAHAVHILWP